MVATNNENEFRMDMKMALNSEIVSLGQRDEDLTSVVNESSVGGHHHPTVVRSNKKSVVNTNTTEWNVGMTGGDGTF
jgi:hypothetical protein